MRDRNSKEYGEEFERRQDALNWFSAEMMRKLEIRISRGGWKASPLGFLFSRLLCEVAELADEIHKDRNDDCNESHVIEEAVDVANYAMMIADVARRRGK